MKKISICLIVLIASLILISCELTGTAPEKGTLHVVAIGSDFEKIGNEERRVVYKGVLYYLPPLDCCRSDADAVCQALEYWGKKAGMKTDIVNLSNGYFQDYVDGLNHVLNAAGPNDLTVLYVSTHGGNDIKNIKDYSDPISTNCFFAIETQADELECAYVEVDRLKEIANLIPGKVLIVGDFCYSGAMVSQDNYTYNENNFSGSSPLDLFFSATTATDSNKVFYLSASKYYQLSYTGNAFGLPLSLFTWHFLRSLGMTGYNKTTGKVAITPEEAILKNNKIILSEIFKYIYNETLNSQVPQMNTGANDLVLFSL